MLVSNVIIYGGIALAIGFLVRWLLLPQIGSRKETLESGAVKRKSHKEFLFYVNETEGIAHATVGRIFFRDHSEPLSLKEGVALAYREDEVLVYRDNDYFYIVDGDFDTLLRAPLELVSFQGNPHWPYCIFYLPDGSSVVHLHPEPLGLPLNNRTFALSFSLVSDGFWSEFLPPHSS